MNDIELFSVALSLGAFIYGFIGLLINNPQYTKKKLWATILSLAGGVLGCIITGNTSIGLYTPTILYFSVISSSILYAFVTIEQDSKEMRMSRFDARGLYPLGLLSLAYSYGHYNELFIFHTLGLLIPLITIIGVIITPKMMIIVPGGDLRMYLVTGMLASIFSPIVPLLTFFISFILMFISVSVSAFKDGWSTSRKKKRPMAPYYMPSFLVSVLLSILGVIN